MSYGHHRDGTKVPEPIDTGGGRGPFPVVQWEILSEGVEVPQVHREYIENYHTGIGQWCRPRRCHSTMTPIWARIWGDVRAIAVLKEL